MKICVYAISKNEEKFVKRFCDSAKDADCIVIADTGSTDKTVEIAKAYESINIYIYNIFVQPWRFDTARNIALGLVPSDIDVCISLDLDEVLLEGWREEIEKVWTVGETNTMHHLFQNKDVFPEPYRTIRIFSRFGWTWKGLCHERLCLDPRVLRQDVSTDSVLIEHLPDKTKSRDYYADLIKANVVESPSNLCARYYYARQLFINEKWEKCIKEIDKLLQICPPNISRYRFGFNSYELNHTYMIKGSSWLKLGEYNKTIDCYKIACDMQLGVRRPFITLALLYYNHENYALCYKYCMKALKIQRKLDVRGEGSWRYWGYAPWNWAAASACRMGWMNKAIECEKRAIELSPDNEKLKNNIKIYESLMDKDH